MASGVPNKAAILLAAVAGLVAGVTLALLIILGGLAANLGGASIKKGALRIAFWGTVAMGCTAIIGHLFGTVL